MTVTDRTRKQGRLGPGVSIFQGKWTHCDFPEVRTREDQWKIGMLRHLSGSQPQSHSQDNHKHRHNKYNEGNEKEEDSKQKQEQRKKKSQSQTQNTKKSEEEHEGERTFDWDERIDPKLVMRMNQLRDLLKMKGIGRAAHLGPDVESDIEEGEAKNFREELEALLRSFEEDEILPQEGSEALPLDEPVLRLLIQSRCFRICRHEFFCPDEGRH
jgi:hypothetical protein